MTEIIYAEGAENKYLPDADLIILDEKLKKYEKAHELIKKHELEHAKDTGLIRTLKHEFTTDIQYHFSNSEEIQEVREYIREREERVEEPGWKWTIIFQTRSTWLLFIHPASFIYRGIRKLIRGDTE